MARLTWSRCLPRLRVLVHNLKSGAWRLSSVTVTFRPLPVAKCKAIACKMSAKTVKEEKPLLSRCLAIVFKEKKSKKQTPSPESQSDHEKPCTTVPVTATGPKTGKDIFDAFVTENRTCYWNPHLEESVRNLKYMGCLHPSTVLVGGRDIYMDTVKAAWARKALRAPVNFSIVKAGEVSGLAMDLLPQTQFTPLPEALCIIIAELTRSNSSTASLDKVLDKLRDTYYGVQQPSEQIVYETLGSLIKERKLYHTGSGYGIMSPEMYQLNGCVTVQDHHLVIGGDPSSGQLPAIYIPLMPPGGPTKAEMRSISCQTEQKQDGKTAAKDKSPSAKDKSPVATKEEKLGKKAAEKQDKADKQADKLDRKSEKSDKEETSPSSKLDRSYSMREKKSKDKKEESLGRSASVRYNEEKAKAIVKDINLKTCDVHQDKDKGEKSSLLSKLFGRNKKKPAAEEEERQPEMEYATFSAQFPPPEWGWYEHQVQTALWVQHQQVPKSQTWHHLQQPPQLADYAEEENLDPVRCPMRKSHTLPPEVTPATRPGGGGGCRQRSGSCHSQDSYSSYEHPSASSKPGKHRKQKTPVDKKNLYQPDHSIPNNSVSSPDHHLDARPKIMLANHNLFGRAMETNLDEIPTDYPDSSIYQDYSYDSQQQPSTEELPPQPQSNQRKSRVFRKYREMHCASFPNSDISMEYQGRLPQKNGRMSQSRDSGVNCVGLSLTDNCGGVPLNNGQQQHQQQHTNMNITENGNGLNMHEAQIHSIPEHVPEDSGFNSPRAADLYAGQIGAGASWDDNVVVETNKQYNLGYSKPNNVSSESLPLDGSELYPPNGCLQSSNHSQPLYGSSSWSSSVQTVREVPVPPPRDHSLLPPSECQPHPMADMNALGLRANVVRREPFMDIQLVPEHRKHSRTKHKDKSRDRSPKRHSGSYRDYQQARDLSPPRGKHGHSSSRKNSRDHSNKHKDWDNNNHSPPQHQYYKHADYEVVGVV